MFYSKEELERLRKKGQETQREMEFDKKAKKYTSNNVTINCIICKHDTFEMGSALLNSKGMTFFDLDWLDEEASLLICSNCGYIHWFNRKPEPVKE